MDEAADDPQPDSYPDTDLRPKAVGRRRVVLGIGFGAALLALGRRLPGRPDGGATAGGPTTIPAVPRSSTSRPPEPPTTSTGGPDETTTTVDTHRYDLVVAGGRVIDPETGFDAVAQLAEQLGGIAG